MQNPKYHIRKQKLLAADCNVSNISNYFEKIKQVIEKKGLQS